MARSIGLAVSLGSLLGSGRADAPTVQPPGGSRQILSTMMANEDAAAKHRDMFAYTSKEKSERTGGHLWTERVVETRMGKIRFLLAEDGKPLGPEREAAERGKLAEIVADPAAFTKREQAQKDDETHAKNMLSVLPKAFVLGDVHEEDGILRIDYKPDPSYQPQSIEERVLHGMSGTVWVDGKTMRLHRVDGRLSDDVTIGFGLLATIRAGSNFDTERDPFQGGEWKTTMINTDINGKAIFFKAIARKQHTERAQFQRVPDDIGIAQAVAVAEQQ
jgi:hypothetical protein